MKQTDGNKLVALGARIEELARAKGISIEDLAHMTEKDYSHLRKICRGEVDIRATSIYALAAALGVEPGELFPREKP